MIDLNLRMPKNANWKVKLRQLGLMRNSKDIDGNSIIVKKKGVDIYQLPPMVKTKGTYDANGNELTPPTFFPAQHFNIRISNRKIIKNFRTFKQNAKNGNIKDTKHRNETSYKHRGVTVVDMETVATSAVVWL
ncbi:MAG: hypothetical protein GY943_30330 [Chloroflexi bacterium]|nr:hypothetical protein [Chloroflexota bacterium]